MLIIQAHVARVLRVPIFSSFFLGNIRFFENFEKHLYLYEWKYLTCITSEKR